MFKTAFDRLLSLVLQRFVAVKSITLLQYTEYMILVLSVGHGVAQLVEALRYKSEGRGFDS